MINPSANGWIEKFFSENQSNFIDFQGGNLSFYEDCRATGFIYGYVVRFQLQNQIDVSKWSYDEITKVAFLNTLYSVYQLQNSAGNKEDFIDLVYEFYKIMKYYKISQLDNLVLTYYPS